MKKNIITSLLIVLTNFAFGQYQQYEQYITPYLSDSIQSGYFYLNQPNNIQAGQLYQAYRQNAPDLNNNMVLIDTHVDSLAGLKHYKYEQTYMNIPIEGAGCIEHYNTDGSLLFLNGKFADSIKKSHEPEFGKQEAVKILLEQLKRDERIKFAWEDEDWEHQIQLDENDSTATWFPEAELIWAVDTMKNMQVVIPGYRYSLAYKITVKFLEPEFETFTYFIDAQSGNILKRYTTKISDGPAHINVYGTQIIDTRYNGGIFGANAHILHTNDGTRDIHTKKNPSGSTAWWLLSNSTSSSGSWAYSDLQETSAHYFASKSWDYYRQYFSRIGLEGAGNEIRVRTQVNTSGAFYDNQTSPRELIFGYNSMGKHYSSEPSVIAHEITHGITDYTAGLVYEYESGALNESFSDIFGIVIHANMLDGGFTDWIIGNSILSSIQETRSLKSPKDYGLHLSNGVAHPGQPDTYNGDYWCDDCPNTQAGDYGGVHINSGVQNKWFYILASGDSGFNDNNDNYNVSGIGMNKAAKIAYFALTSMLQNSSQYSDARQATITAAKILFGECSVEHQATVDAWYAVGIGNLNDCDYTLSNDDIISIDEEVLIYPNPTTNNLTIEVPNRIDNQITIYDATGKITESFNNTNLVFSIDVSHLNNGVYYINFTINDNPIKRRFIVQK